MLKLLAKITLIFVLGGLGGIIFERTLVPWLARYEPFSRIPSLTVERTTIVNPTTEVIINEAQALEAATRNAYSKLALIRREGAGGEVLASASGAVLTADGIVVTTDDVLGMTGTYMLYREREAVPARFIASDVELGIVLLKAEVSGWPVVEYVQSSDLALGKRLFLLAGERDPGYEPLIASLKEGAITKVEGEAGPEISDVLALGPAGSPVFTIEGRILGIIAETQLVPIQEIRGFFDRTDTAPPLETEGGV